MSDNRFASFSNFDDLFASSSERSFSAPEPDFDAYLASMFNETPASDASTSGASSSDDATIEPPARPRVVRPSPATPGAPAGVPFPGTEAALSKGRLPEPWYGRWVSVFVPDELQVLYGQVRSVDLAIGRVVAQTETEVVELDITPDLTFFLGGAGTRVKLEGERGAQVADRLLDLLHSAPRPITPEQLMAQAMAGLRPQTKKGLFSW